MLPLLRLFRHYAMPRHAFIFAAAISMTLMRCRR